MRARLLDIAIVVLLTTFVGLTAWCINRIRTHPEEFHALMKGAS